MFNPIAKKLGPTESRYFGGFFCFIGTSLRLAPRYGPIAD